VLEPTTCTEKGSSLNNTWTWLRYRRTDPSSSSPAPPSEGGPSSYLSLAIPTAGEYNEDGANTADLVYEGEGDLTAVHRANHPITKLSCVSFRLFNPTKRLASCPSRPVQLNRIQCTKVCVHEEHQTVLDAGNRWIMRFCSFNSPLLHDRFRVCHRYHSTYLLISLCPATQSATRPFSSGVHSKLSRGTQSAIFPIVSYTNASVHSHQLALAQ